MTMTRNNLQLTIFVIIVIVGIEGAVHGKSVNQTIKDAACPDMNAIFQIMSDSRYAYAGVSPNPNYFCFTSQPFFLNVHYRLSLSHQYTDNLSPQLNGCDFVYCPDPVLRQRIAAANLCNNWQSATAPQQIVDRFMLTLNQPGWLYVASSNSLIGVFHPDNNYCYVEFTANYWNLIAVKLEMAAG